MNSVIHDLEHFGLGLLRDGRVLVQEHNPLWARAFAEESKRLAGALGDSNFTFHHIGSTAIPGIHAKPILDLLITAPNVESLDAKKGQFESLGYEYKGEYGIPGRRYSVLYNPEKTKGYIHVHAFAARSHEAEQHLLFRDFLIARPDQAKAYEDFKLSLLRNPSLVRSDYTEAKSPLIGRLLKEAQAWAAVCKR